VAVPGLSDWREQILRGVNAPVTPANLLAFNAWQRAEGGTYANNPFNTTLKTAFQVGDPNSAGVRGYSTPQAGIDATVRTLLGNSGGTYANILSALRSGRSARAVGEAIEGSPWGTGGLVLKVLGAGDVPTAAVPTTAGPSPGVSASVQPPTMSNVYSPTPAPSLPQPNVAGALLSSLNQGPGALLNALVGAQFQAKQQAAQVPSSTPLPSLPTPPLSGGVQAPGTETGAGVPATTVPRSDFKPGSPVPTNFLSSIGAEHPTAGLDGYPAYDYMGKAGSPVVAPVGGKIIRFSGHDPAGGPTSGVHGPFGWSLYLQGEDGRTYYMTHMGSRDVRVGQKVAPGTVLGTIGNYAKWGGADHVHMGVN